MNEVHSIVCEWCLIFGNGTRLGGTWESGIGEKKKKKYCRWVRKYTPHLNKTGIYHGSFFLLC